MEKIQPQPKSQIEVFFEALSKRGPVQYKVIMPDEYVPPITHFDFSTLEAATPYDTDNIQRATKEMYERCVTYLKRPILIDSLTDHTERRRWQGELTKDESIAKVFTPFQQSNKLRFNNISLLNEMQHSLKLYLTSKAGKVHWIKKDAIVNLINEEFPTFNDYGTIDLETKLERVAQLDRFCRKYIDLFA